MPKYMDSQLITTCNNCKHCDQLLPFGSKHNPLASCCGELQQWYRDAVWTYLIDDGRDGTGRPTHKPNRTLVHHHLIPLPDQKEA